MFPLASRGVITKLLVCASFALLTTGESVADTNNGSRTNSRPCNGYYITDSSLFLDVDSGIRYPYDEYFEHAISSWRGISARVDQGMLRVQYTGFPPRVSVNADRLSVTAVGPLRVLGLSIVVYPLPSTGETLSGTQLDDVDWIRTEIVLYHENIKEAASDNYDALEHVAKANATHEIGHSLKLDHPPGGPLNPDGSEHKGEGTKTSRNVPPGQQSIMFWRFDIIPGTPASVYEAPIVPQVYDREELVSRWGGM